MRFLFIIQGEGRGHMTQAISLADMLRANGHEVTRAIVGKSERRQLPAFFKESIRAAVDQVDSPNFAFDKNGKSVHLGKTILKGLANFSAYRASVRQIHRMVEEDEPDVIVNFYDFIGGLYFGLKKPKAKFIVVGHQYLARHPTFQFPTGRHAERWALLLANRVTSWGSALKLALSFRELPDEPDVHVVPPLLRAEVRSLEPTDGGHLLVYMLNHGYATDVDAFHKKYPKEKIVCFWDKKEAPDKMIVDEHLIYYRLDAKLFLEYMASCKGFQTTAGFESVCEAMYLGKPVMMMPVDGHYEQACNAIDGVTSGAGIRSSDFDLEKLIDYLPEHVPNREVFSKWSDRADGIFLKFLTS